MGRSSSQVLNWMVVCHQSVYYAWSQSPFYHHFQYQRVQKTFQIEKMGKRTKENYEGKRVSYLNFL